MKQFSKLFFAAAVAALGLASCAKEVAQVETPKDNLVTVHFGATAGIEGATKATLTPDEQETLFTSAWENGDVLSVKYTNDNETVGATTKGTVSASWSTDHFEATMPEYKGTWDYNVVYPAPDTESAVDFGSTRTQKGNAYNSKYDLMKGSAIAEGADAGKTADRKNIVFEMTRQTAIAYFHLTSTLDEEVVSAKLSVEGKDAYLSTSDVQIGKDNSGDIDYAKGYTFTETEGVASKEINLTFTGEAPRSSDFKLWFNVLPTIYDKMTLTVETTNNTLTISRKATDMYEAGKLYKVVKKIPAEKWVKKGGGETPVVESWIATDLADITATDEVVITMAKGESVYALSAEADAKSNNPQAVLVPVKNGELTAAPADNLVWNIANDEGNLTIYPKGQTDKWLYSDSKTDVRVGNSTTNKIFTLDAETKYLKNTGANRYLGVYNNADWRCYNGMHANIAGQTLCFYVKGTPKTALETPANIQVSAAKVVSWNAVSGAASYDVTIGTKTFTSETNSYNASALADEYYDVTVVAVPSDKENYKNSAAATINGAKFGTPTLATPTLKEGVIDGASISVSWSVDERATAGYNCELFKGDVKVGESQTVNAGAVTFTGLDAETAYVVKVNAIAVGGAKSYAASSVATLDVTTKAASATANDGSLERPYTAAEAIAAIDANTGLTGKYVKGIVKAAPSFDARYNSLTYDIESGAKTLNIYSGKDLGNAGFVGTEDLKAGDEVVVYGDLKLYKNNNKTTYELDKNNHLISINGETQIYRGLAVSEPKTAFTVGDAFEGGKVLQVWRGKENVDVTASATFSGYNMSTEGKQTVTVTVGNESVTYEITVNPAGTVLEKSETITLKNGKFSNSTITWSGASCSFVQEKGKSSAAPNKDYISAPRWYASNVITFKANAGYKITKVVVTCTSNTYANALQGATYTPNTTSATASNAEVTITTVSDFTITMKNKAFIKSVVVYYTD